MSGAPDSASVDVLVPGTLFEWIQVRQPLEPGREAEPRPFESGG